MASDKCVVQVLSELKKAKAELSEMESKRDEFKRHLQLTDQFLLEDKAEFDLLDDDTIKMINSDPVAWGEGWLDYGTGNMIFNYPSAKQIHHLMSNIRRVKANIECLESKHQQHLQEL